MSQITAEWTPTQEEFDAFARISGDDNPIHVDFGFSSRTRFGRTVAHGMLIYSKLWTLLRDARPHARHVSQSLMFPNPCFAGESVMLEVELHAENRFYLRAVRRADEAELLIGETEVA
ncbi:MaoC/PaaZ C-terminal domain-containing protein [Tranquillimonas alkanivorans]|uniref:MaoC like domain-containing protein n=1 Tax=Tranquillimonas alkanivorans TaxID=441119 RepID=A0A1I5US04_9RHOB|nr:MaoC/PaaZ C-terminal domain-containing protein [Tranquillimonas alkanivorans]SFP97817.1 MaoC like domain-containing protein [Tranquillimonas alkanivorans]